MRPGFALASRMSSCSDDVGNVAVITNTQRLGGDARNGRERLESIERQLRLDDGIRYERRRCKQQCRAIGRRLGHHVGGLDVARAIVDADGAGKLARDDSRDDVRRRAGGAGNDELDGLRQRGMRRERRAEEKKTRALHAPIVRCATSGVN